MSISLFTNISVDYSCGDKTKTTISRVYYDTFQTLPKKHLFHPLAKLSEESQRESENLHTISFYYAENNNCESL